jgi:hypothetical protein
MQSTFVGIIFSFFGVIAVAAGILNWQMLLDPKRNYTFINAMGPTGKRVFYILLGFFIWGVGIAFLTGVLRFGSDR